MGRPSADVALRAFLVAVAACSPPPIAEHAPVPPPPAATRATKTSDAGADAGAATDRSLRTELVPGCAESDVEATRRDLEAIAQLASSNGAADTALAKLRALWQRPCLAHVARFVPAPGNVATESFVHAMEGSYASQLAEAVGGLQVELGKRLYVLPREIEPLPAASPAALALVTCASDAASCGHAAAYVGRADRHFDAVEELEMRGRSKWLHSTSRYVDAAWCTSESASPPSSDQTEFERWARCAVAQPPRSLRFARGRYRAPERGWLLLRGIRGHYRIAIESRAYDLATGAAYVVSWDRGMDAPKKGPEAFTGAVASEHVRELAFVLLARAALVSFRTDSTRIGVPDGMAFALSPPPHTLLSSTGRVSWSSSDQTTLAWDYVEGGERRASGTFTWPQSADWYEDYVGDLVRVMEAGLERGCAPARLPAKLPRMNAESEHAREVRTLIEDLEKKLEPLRAKPCVGAK